MEDKKHIATLQMQRNSEVQDLDSLRNEIDQMWQFETELNLRQGCVEIWRVED